MDDTMEINTTFSITGEATATAGYDLDDQVFGFKNASSSDISIQFVPKSTRKNGAMDGWHGSIELKDFQILIDSNEEESEEFLTHEAIKDDGTLDPTKKARTGLYVKAPDIVAKVVNGPLFLKIFAEPSNKADLIGHIEDDEDNDYMAEGDDDGKDVGDEINNGHGITLGFDNMTDLSLEIGVSSEQEFKEVEDTYTQGPFAVSADLGVNVGPAELKLSFVQGIKNDKDDTIQDDDDDTGIGALLITTFGKIKLSGGADVQMTGEHDDAATAENESMHWEGGADATVELTDNSKLMADFIFSSREKVASDVAVDLEDKSGLVEDLDMSLRWGLFDITGGDDAEGAPMTENHLSDLLVEGSLDYHLDAMGGTLTPGTTVTVNQLDGSPDHTYVGLKLRAVLKDAIPATKFGLEWATDRLVDSGSNKMEQGTVSLWTTIKY